jgi:predicted peroxiredoxin
MTMKNSMPMLIVLGLFLAIGCNQSGQEAVPVATKTESQVMLFNMTSGATEDPHAVTMALQLAGHALDDGREVVLFFNVRGVNVPTTALPADLAFKDKPIKQLLAQLIERGAEVHVCPHCLNALEVNADDLISGAVVTDRDKLFSKVGSNTVVFTY